MARNSRQSKILELISTQEIETQEELVSALKNAEFDVTQATISRDIKELGLIKILTDSKKYKYAVVNSQVQALSNKCLNIFKECVISIKSAMNLTIVKVIKGTAGALIFIIKFSFVFEKFVLADFVLVILYYRSEVNARKSTRFLWVFMGIFAKKYWFFSAVLRLC